ncbi:glycosyltransferase family 4 protein [Bradyrhizobium diazoefficiens]|uniref:glycosyltransferase family 4 protein n=1 Tax=Bradyrhizobium diazoefficiens TaxID=1355477 RepID=UPI00190A74E7|nr:glycosyltransferase family 4 protein [Bradyrhizobium diazoefficiens]MBK3665348.1 glycosyltransferase family 4 protein [Bradyrhizobium diazoefficiens]
MKILLVSSGSGSRGGGEIFLLYLGRALAARGHSVMTWMPTHRRMDELASQCAEFSEVIRADYVNTYDHRSRSLATLFNAGQTNALASQWRALKPDVVHINKQNLEDGLDLLRAARISGLPSVCTVHLTQTARYLRARGALLRDIVAAFELRKFKGAFAAVQEVRRKELSSFLGPDARTETIFNGVPQVDLSGQQTMRQAARVELGIADNQFLVVGLGRLVAQKNPFTFLEVARRLCRQHDHLRFVWVGDGELAGEWKAAVDREGLGLAIRCAGWKSEVRPYLAAADLFLHTAEYEGLPFALIEAMSMGLPSAVSATVAAELPFLNAGNAIFYDRDGRLEHLIARSQELGAIGEAGRVMVTQQFADTAMAAGYEKLYAGEVARCS